jgi:putative proteasome-type protease
MPLGPLKGRPAGTVYDHTIYARPGRRRVRSRGTVTYCLGIVTDDGLVMASDSRSNAGFDQVNVCRKMYRFVIEDERVFVILSSGSLSISQSVISLLRVDFDAGLGLAKAPSSYHAARIVGETVR